MYGVTGSGPRYLVVDAHVHAWDASPHNQAGPAGEAFATDLLRRHRELDGPGGAGGAGGRDRPVPPEEVERVTEDGLARDLFEAGYVDRAVLQPVVLGDLFVLGFSPVAWHAELASRMPGRFVLSGELDPDAGQAGARGIGPQVRRWDLRGLTLCEARRPGRLVRLSDPWLRRVLARCSQAGAGVVHLGVAPSARPAPWRRWDADLGRSGPRLPNWAEPVRAGSALPVRTNVVRRVPSAGFDVGHFRELARALPRVQFVLGAGCLPGGQLCGLGRLPNVHVVLTEMLPWIGTREFATAFGELLAAFGPERLLFGSGYPLVRPARLVARLASFTFPDELAGRYPEFDVAARQAVLGGNAARLYRVPLPAGALPRPGLRQGAGS
jgi:predicted TIM-barrel fold metal-dependent hydrolase